jgi:hypothetical protein
MGIKQPMDQRKIPREVRKCLEMNERENNEAQITKTHTVKAVLGVLMLKPRPGKPTIQLHNLNPQLAENNKDRSRDKQNRKLVL